MPSAAQAPAYQEFLRRLRAAREHAGLRQVEVARLLGKPQSYVSKCESGERRIDVVELAAFADVYQLPMESFVPRKVKRPKIRRNM
jgi:transcriptional regulator with XRE-family HTH domain